MQKYKKPVFTEKDLGFNPFIRDLVILTRKFEDKNVYKYEDGMLMNNSITLEYTSYTKVFNTSEHRMLINNLSNNAKSLFLWLIYEVEAGKDYLWLNIDRYMEEQRIKSINTVKTAIKELSRYGMINQSVIRTIYWINPDFFFNGNRINKYKENIIVK